MGLGDDSIRKSYYPELQSKIDELNKEKDFISDIINSMPSVIIGIDRHGKITHWNRNAEMCYGIPFQDAQGQELSYILPYLKKELQEIVDSAKELSEQLNIKKTRRSDSGIIYEEIAIYRLNSSSPGGAVIRIDDITERIRMQETMIQSEKMLSVGGLAAGMAHEINNPLAGIMQTAEVMAKRLMEKDLPANKAAAEKTGIKLNNLIAYLDERGIGKMLQAINESGRRAALIIRNMLKFSRQEDTFSLQDPVEMLNLILDLASTDFNLKKHFDFKNINIEKEFAPDLPKIPCSETQIQQVILNLLRNGTEAMNEINDINYKPQFILRIKREETVLRLEIEDNGPGISADDIEHIFDPFYTTKPVGIGTGLGLSVSYFIIVDNHKGTMEVESEPGKGARFIIRLPLKRQI